MAQLKPAVFVLGVPRSGTTLLRVMLAGHPKLFSPPEMILAPFETMAERKARLEQRFWEKGGLRRALMELHHVDVERAKALEADLQSKSIPEVYALLQAQLGDRLLVDKCPHLCAAPEALQRLEGWFRDARYLWIVRHPGSVVRSLENMPFAEVMLQGYADDARDIWAYGNRVIETFLQGLPKERWLRLRYEDLVAEPRKIMEQACRTLGVPFDAAVLEPYEGDRMREGPQGARSVGDPNMAGRGRIQPELAQAWLDGFDPASVSPETHALASAYGYDLSALPPPPVRKVSAALSDLWGTAAELEKSIRIPMDLDALEGRRFLLRLIAASVDTQVEHGDPERPHFVHAEGPTRKTFADCPDADYLRAPIALSPGVSYQVRGRLPPGTTYVGVLLYRKGGVLGRSLNDEQLAVDGEGRFEVNIALTEQPGVWLQAAGDETAVMVRQYFVDRRQQAPLKLDLERLGPAPLPRPLEAERLARQIERAHRMVKTVFERTVQTYRLASNMAMNRFIEVPAEQLFPTPDNEYRAAWYRLGDDQLMLVRGQLPRARYFGVCLYNAWLESYDYTEQRIHLNHAQIVAEPDGRFELCVAHRNPGHANWLDTAGHRAGYIIVRTLLGTSPSLESEVLYEREWKARR